MGTVATMKKEAPISKKDLVRRWAKTARDGTTWSLQSIANACGNGVGTKDADNVVRELMKGGCLIREDRGKAGIRFLVNANSVAMFFAKYPNGIVPKKAVAPINQVRQERPSIIVTAPKIKRKPNRSPLVLAIDSEIKELEAKIVRLKGLRKEFS